MRNLVQFLLREGDMLDATMAVLTVLAYMVVHG